MIPGTLSFMLAETSLGDRGLRVATEQKVGLGRPPGSCDTLREATVTALLLLA
jgi:hypothetical protein